MLRIPSDKRVYAMGAGCAPVAEAKPGDLVIFETKDAFGDQIQSERDLFQPGSWAGINPATGPLRVVGARAGDVLAVDVVDIRVGPQGAMIAVPGMGALGHHITHNQTKIMAIEDGKVLFAEGLRLPVRPMIGVIGTAPCGPDVLPAPPVRTEATWIPS